MTSATRHRHPLIDLVDEVTRLHGRLKTAFADARREIGFGQSEMTVLNAVVEADRPPTVAQIGRSMGQPRQVIQRAANLLLDEGLIVSAPNPDHKRAALLLPTAEGTALKRKVDAKADEIARSLAQVVDLDEARTAIEALNAVRRALEIQHRQHARKVEPIS